MARCLLGVGVFCSLLASQAGAQDQARKDEPAQATSYNVGWGGGFEGRPWFDGGWPDYSGPPTDPRWYGFSGNPVWGNDSIRPARQTQKTVAFVLKPELPAEQPEAQPEPARSELHEYEWPDSGSVRPTFSIALKSGTTRPAVVVCVQEDTVFYAGPDGSREHIALDAIDFVATRNLNRKQGLRLWLPADDTSSKGQ